MLARVFHHVEVFIMKVWVAWEIEYENIEVKEYQLEVKDNKAAAV